MSDPPAAWVFRCCKECGAPIYYRARNRTHCARCRPLIYKPGTGGWEHP